MAFTQVKLTKSFNQSRGIFDKYVYQPGNSDSISTILGSGYFDDSRYLDDPDWLGSIMEISATNGYAIARIATGGLVVLYDSTGGGSVNVEWGGITGDINSQADLAEVAKTNDYDDLSNRPSLLVNRVVVKQAADFGVIDSTKEYFLDGIIDFTGTGLSLEIPSGGIYITGYNFDTSGLKCTDAAYTLFTSPVGGSGNILFKDFFIDIQGASSQVYDITGDTGFEAIEVDRINFNNCTSLGTVDTYRQGLETGTGRFGGTPELTLAGTWLGGYFIDTSIVRSLSNAAFTLYKAGTAFVMNSRFRSNQNIDLPALASFVDFAPANFTNPSTLQLEQCIITRNGVSDSGDANLTPNISASDLESSWTSNNGLPNTFEGGRANVTVEATTTIVQNVFTDLLGTWTTSGLQHFDSPSSGQLRHLGNSPREYKVLSSIVLEGNQNDIVTIKIVKFDSSATSFIDVETQTRTINQLQGPRNVGFFSIFAVVTLDKDDYVKIQVTDTTASNDVTAEIDAFLIVDER